MGDSFDRRVDGAVDLLDHNESVVAFENLVSNIHEFSVSITKDEYALIEAVACAWNVDPGRWAYVAEVVR